MFNFIFDGKIGDMLAPIQSRVQQFHLAIQHHRNHEVDSMMASGGIELGNVTSSGYADVHVASRYNNRYALEVLLSRGISINHRDRDGNTPLHYAAKNGHIDICKFLVERKASTSIRNSQGQSAYDVAQSHIVRQFLLPLQLSSEREDPQVHPPPPGATFGSSYFGGHQNTQNTMPMYAPPGGTNNSHTSSTSLGGVVSPHQQQPPLAHRTPLPSAHQQPPPPANQQPPPAAHQPPPPQANHQPPPAAHQQPPSPVHQQPPSGGHHKPLPSAHQQPTPPANHKPPPPAYHKALPSTHQQPPTPPYATSTPSSAPPSYQPPREAHNPPISGTTSHSVNKPAPRSFEGFTSLNSPHVATSIMHPSYSGSDLSALSQSLDSSAPVQATVAHSSSNSRRIIQPDGFGSSASDPVLQKKYGHTKTVTNIAPPPVFSGSSGTSAPPAAVSYSMYGTTSGNQPAHPYSRYVPYGPNSNSSASTAQVPSPATPPLPYSHSHSHPPPPGRPHPPSQEQGEVNVDSPHVRVPATTGNVSMFNPVTDKVVSATSSSSAIL